MLSLTMHLFKKRSWGMSFFQNLVFAHTGKNKMVAEFVIRTAEWIRDLQSMFEAEFIGQSDSKSCIATCYTLITPSWT